MSSCLFQQGSKTQRPLNAFSKNKNHYSVEITTVKPSQMFKTSGGNPAMTNSFTGKGTVITGGSVTNIS